MNNFQVGDIVLVKGLEFSPEMVITHMGELKYCKTIWFTKGGMIFEAEFKEELLYKKESTQGSDIYQDSDDYKEWADKFYFDSKTGVVKTR